MWHGQVYDQLHEALGMTWDEYKAWIERGNAKTTELGAARLDVCGTCGSQVRVVTSDEGTSYYASLTPADLAAEAFTREELAELRGGLQKGTVIGASTDLERTLDAALHDKGER